MVIVGYVSVCVQLYKQTAKREQADKHTRKKTTKIAKENRTGTKHK
jgi:hypothetical protein